MPRKLKTPVPAVDTPAPAPLATPERKATKAILLGLVALGLLIRLPVLSHPREVVFDEFHFGKFITAYCCTHEHFWDVHPPHAKLALTAMAWLAGYKGGFGWERIGAPMDPAQVPIFAMRLLPALAGTLLPVLTFVLLLQLRASLAAAFLASLCLALDSGLWVVTRFIQLDAFLVLAILTACSAWLAAKERPTFRARLPWLVLCGMACGFAVGTKYTGLTSLAVVGIGMLREWWRRRDREGFTRFCAQGGVILAMFVLVYVAGWIIHFQFPWQKGPGHAFYVPTGDFFHDFYHQQRVMMISNNGITAVHHDSSRWWTWPWMAVPVYYWVKDKAVIYLIGNPIVWWGSAVLVIAGTVTHALRRVTGLTYPREGTAHPRLWLPTAGLWISFLPYAFVSRPLFIYHYLPPLVFVVMWALAWLDRIGWTRPGPLANQRKSYWVAVGLVVAGFLVMLPFTSGFPIGAGFRATMFKVFPLWP